MATSQVRLLEIGGKNFRSFDSFQVKFPESGMFRVCGTSGAGKSSLVMAPSWLLGGCPYPGTELQSWHTEDPATAWAILGTPAGEVRVQRSVKGGWQLGDLKGKEVEPELARLFGGMDDKLRGAATYRAQDGEGAFLKLPDERKKHLLAQALGVTGYERIARDAGEALQGLRRQADTVAGRLDVLRQQLARDEASLPPEPAAVDDQRPALENALKHERMAYDKIEACIVAIRNSVDKEAAAASAVVWESAGPRPEQEIAPEEAELEVVRARLKKVEAADNKSRLEVERERGRLRTRVATLEAAVSRAGQLRARVDVAARDLDKLRAGTCPTCAQPWTDEGACDRAHGAYQAAQDDLGRAEAADVELGIAKAALALLRDPEPHRFGAPLRASETELMFACQTARTKQASAARTWEQAVRARAQEAEEGVRAIASQELRTQEYDLARYRARVDELAGKISAIRDRVVSFQAARQAYDRATLALQQTQVSLAAADTAYAEAQRALNLELDVQAVAGRSGYLSVIFDDALHAVATEVNASLAEVANTRHLVFEWDQEEARITPVVRVAGEARPMRSALSGGMASVVYLAVDLALARVCTDRHGVYPGWLVLDESFNGLDAGPKEAALEILKRYASDRLILVIDHNTNFTGVFDGTIEVSNEDGRSVVKYGTDLAIS